MLDQLLLASEGDCVRAGSHWSGVLSGEEIVGRDMVPEKRKGTE